MYEDFMAYFTNFISRHVNQDSSRLQREELCHVFSLSCQVLVLLGRSLAASSVAVHTLDEGGICMCVRVWEEDLGRSGKEC